MGNKGKRKMAMAQDAEGGGLIDTRACPSVPSVTRAERLTKPTRHIKPHQGWAERPSTTIKNIAKLPIELYLDPPQYTHGAAEKHIQHTQHAQHAQHVQRAPPSRAARTRGRGHQQSTHSTHSTRSAHLPPELHGHEVAVTNKAHTARTARAVRTSQPSCTDTRLRSPSTSSSPSSW